MPEKYFLSLDYRTGPDAVRAANAATAFLRETWPSAFNEQNVGVKINQDLMTGHVDAGLMRMPNVFADLKISHGSDTGERIIDQVDSHFPDLRFVTVAASLGPEILGQYVRYAKTRGRHRGGVGVIAFTAHTKMPAEDVQRVFKAEDLNEAILRLGQVAVDAGCDAIVLEAERLKDQRIAKLPIKKLVTGIRIDPEDKGSQSRVTSLDQLSEVLKDVDYVVVSSRYLEKPEALRFYFTQLLRNQ